MPSWSWASLKRSATSSSASRSTCTNPPPDGSPAEKIFSSPSHLSLTAKNAVSQPRSQVLARENQDGRSWMPRRHTIAGSQLGRLCKQERNGSLGTTRKCTVKPFRSNKGSRTSETYVSENGENALFDLLVLLHFPVADVDDAVRVQRDVVFVRHQHDRVALLKQPLEQPHDFVARGRVQV